MPSVKSNPRKREKIATILTGVILIGVVGSLVGWRGFLAGRASAMHERALDDRPIAVTVNWPVIPGSQGPDGLPVPWMSEGIRRQLVDMIQAELTSDPMDHASLQRAADRLISTGWVAKLRGIKRENDHVVSINAEWRAPVALVRHKDRDYLVAAGGELLPISYPAGSVSTSRVILNPFAGPPEAYGEQWTGGDVQAALSLLTFLAPTEVYPQVVAFDVADYVKRKRLVIVTDQNNRIIWGSAPSEWKPGEPTAQWKLNELLKLRQDAKFNRRIDAGLAKIDLTVPVGVFTETTEAPVDPLNDAAAGPSGSSTSPKPPTNGGQRNQARGH